MIVDLMLEIGARAACTVELWSAMPELCPRRYHHCRIEGGFLVVEGFPQNTMMCCVFVAS